MSVGLVLLNLFAFTFAQYYGQYPYYGGNIRSYPVSNYKPCQSPCQLTNYCQRLPCYYQQQSYNSPFIYHNRFSPYVNYFHNSGKSSEPYANVPVEIVDDNVNQRFSPKRNQYINVPVQIIDDSNLNSKRNNNPYWRRFSTSPKDDPYANVPVEIIDDPSVPRKPLKTNKSSYINVPVEIIDDTDADFWKKIPVLPNITRSSQSSNYTVAQGKVTSNTVTHSNPISATITRSFQPQQKNPVITLDFLNGNLINQNNKTEVNEEITTEEITTITAQVSEVSEEEEEEEEKEEEDNNETVPEVNSWFG